MASLSDDSGLGPIEEEGTRERWLAYLIQNGTYNSQDAPMETLTRPQTLFLETAAHLRDHRDFCPVDEWFIEDYGLSISEQYTLGFAVLATANIMDRSLRLDDRSLLGPDFFHGLRWPSRAGPRRRAGIITAPRSWYAEMFAAGEQTKTRAAWERTRSMSGPSFGWLRRLRGDLAVGDE